MKLKFIKIFFTEFIKKSWIWILSLSICALFFIPYSKTYNFSYNVSHGPFKIEDKSYVILDSDDSRFLSNYNNEEIINGKIKRTYVGTPILLKIGRILSFVVFFIFFLSVFTANETIFYESMIFAVNKVYEVKPVDELQLNIVLLDRLIYSEIFSSSDSRDEYCRLHSDVRFIDNEFIRAVGYKKSVIGMLLAFLKIPKWYTIEDNRDIKLGKIGIN